MRPYVLQFYGNVLWMVYKFFTLQVIRSGSNFQNFVLEKEINWIQVMISWARQ